MNDHNVSQPGSTSTPVSEQEALRNWSPDQAMVQNLKSHVVTLAQEIGERNSQKPENYRKAQEYLVHTLESYGYQVNLQAYPVADGEAANIWTVRPGSPEILVMGAHYDSFPGTPGADDNASGCAALLELGRLLKEQAGGPTVHLVFFANEEPPYFQTEAMGSLVYARASRESGLELLGMISLESLGFYSDDDQSQNFPPGITGYPETGNFVGFVSNLESKPFMERCLSAFVAADTLPAEGLAAPSAIQGVGWSDHWSFWQVGYNALMITDTAPFRNPPYHRSSDTPETLDYVRLAAVVEGVFQVVMSFGEEF